MTFMRYSALAEPDFTHSTHLIIPDFVFNVRLTYYLRLKLCRTSMNSSFSYPELPLYNRQKLF